MPIMYVLLGLLAIGVLIVVAYIFTNGQAVRAANKKSVTTYDHKATSIAVKALRKIANGASANPLLDAQNALDSIDALQ